jgi:hypothetical protein
MSNWVVNSAERYLSLVYDSLHNLIYNDRVIHADESPVKVMRIDNAKVDNGKKTYMWVYRNRPSRTPSSSTTGRVPGRRTTQGNS